MTAVVKHKHAGRGGDGPAVMTSKSDDDEQELESLFSYWKKQPPGKAKAVTLQQLDQDNNCHRCGKKVYPVERLDVGVLYHKACFRCLVCGRQLTLQSFQRQLHPRNSQVKEVYCNSHVPRQGHGGLDHEALSIRSAIDAQRRTDRKVHHRVYPEHSFIPDFPVRGSGDWSSGSSSDAGSRPASGFLEGASAEPEVGEVREIQDAADPGFPQQQQLSDVYPLASESTSTEASSVTDTLPVPVEESDVVGRRQVLLRRQESASERNNTIRRRSTLRSFQDFEKFGVFDAQSMLEKVQRQEEDELYNQIEAERRSLRMRLEEALRNEREASVRDLVAFFKTNCVPGAEQQDALVKVEQYAHKRREAALRELLARLAAEEQAAVARMVEKHSNEMIQLIRRKERSANQTQNKPATSLPPNVAKTTTPHSDNTAQHASVVLPILTRAAEGAANGTGTGTPAVTRSAPLSSTSEEDVDIQSFNSSPRRKGFMRIIPVVQQVSSDESDQPLPTLSKLAIGGESDEVGANQNEGSGRGDKSDTLRGYDREKGGEKRNAVRNRGDQDDDRGVLARGRGHRDPQEAHQVAAGKEDEDSDVDSLELSEAVPEAEPPTCRKGTLYTDPGVFKEQDRRAIAESKKDHKTFTDLVRQLSKRCETELQKVRSIFRWVTVKDLNRMQFDDRLDPNSPLGLLRGIKSGTESYHDLFRRLCSYAGLHCEVIEGYSKGAGYRPGDSIQGETFRNQWTAVWVDGSWRFINCKWGARHVKATRDTSLTYKCDEFYFLTDPEDHIYQHFPDDPMWQLLPEPVRMREFIRLPVLKSPFFNHGLQLGCPYDATLDARDGQTEVCLHSKKLFGVAAKLKSTNKDIPTEILNERTLVRYVSGDFVITLNLPSPGIYFLDIFAASDWDSDRMDNACAFQVRCSGISRHADITYPPIGCFGRTPSFTECGLLEETHIDPYVTPRSGDVSVTYNLTKNVSLKPTLRRWDPRAAALSDYDCYVLFRQRTGHVATFDLRLPRRGIYVLSTYAVNPEDSGASMLCLYRHLVDCTAPNTDAVPFPKASRRFKHCRVVEPLTGDLAPETEVTFVLESRRAVDVMVVFDNKSHNLKVSGKVWRKTVYLNARHGKVTVYARFDPMSDKYIPLLEYRIGSEEKYPSHC